MCDTTRCEAAAGSAQGEAGMTVIYLVQHGEKEPVPGDPGLTGAGREQASRTAWWLRGFGLNAVYSSPQRRARETAEIIASASRVGLIKDVRLRERVNWDDGQALDDFLAEWDRSTRDRDYVPADGDSSRRAGERLRAFLLDVTAEPGPVAAATHGGVTVDLLRTLLGDGRLPGGLLSGGIPPCAITTVHNLEVIEIASVVHLG
jgi:broad specificity phosphatase PhoE